MFRCTKKYSLEHLAFTSRDIPQSFGWILTSSRVFSSVIQVTEIHFAFRAGGSRHLRSCGGLLSHLRTGLSSKKVNAPCPCPIRSRDPRPLEKVEKVLLALSLSIALFASYSARAQEPERKVLKKVTPEYPAILRQRGIGGTVRLQVTVEANGEVSSVAVLGGNAILAEQAQLAVKRWHFAPSPKSTVTEVKVNFDPHWE